MPGRLDCLLTATTQRSTPPSGGYMITMRTMRLALTAVAGLGVGCAGHAPYNPFIVPQERIYGSVKTIAIAPVIAPSDRLDGPVDPFLGHDERIVGRSEEHTSELQSRP